MWKFSKLQATVLISALYHPMSSFCFLALLLLTRWEKTLKTKAVAEETLHQLMPQPYDGS